MSEDEALQRLQVILAQPEYQSHTSQSWWDQLLTPVWDVLRFVLERVLVGIVNAGAGRQGWIGFVVLAICAVLIAFVAVYLVRALRLAVHREATLQTHNLAARRERSEQLWQTAQQLAAAGQWAEAVRAVYLSALYALDERAILHVETSLTNREHVRALDRIQPDLAPTFADVVESYDRLRYGRDPVSESAFADLSRRVARARSAALGGSPAA